jgi:hypothetical protein
MYTYIVLCTHRHRHRHKCDDAEVRLRCKATVSACQCISMPASVSVSLYACKCFLVCFTKKENRDVHPYRRVSDSLGIALCMYIYIYIYGEHLLYVRCHTSEYVRVRPHTCGAIRQNTSEYVHIRQHTPSVSVREHTWAYMSIREYRAHLLYLPYSIH